MTTSLIQNVTGTDQGMPVCNGTAGSRLAVIRYCLVTVGGWDEVYTSGNVAWFRPTDITSNRFYLRVDDSAAQDCRLSGYVTHTSGQDAGTGQFPTNTQVSGGFWLRGSSTANTVGRPWHVVVWEKGIRIIVHHFDGHLPYVGSCLFTDLVQSAKAGDAYHTVIQGIPFAYGSQIGYMSFAQSNIYLAGPYTQSPNSTAATFTAPPGAGSFSYFFGSGQPYPSPISGSGEITPVYVLEGLNLRGRLPGHWGHPYSASTFTDPLPEMIPGRVIKPFSGAFLSPTVTQLLVETSDWGLPL